MLLNNHGASTLGKTLRRPIISTMTSFEGPSTLASDAMRSTMSLFRTGRAISSTPPHPGAANLQRIWRPNHGIVFSNSGSSTPRSMSTIAAAEIEQASIFHSDAENNLVMAKAESMVTGASNLPAEKGAAAVLIEKPDEEASAEDPEQNELPQSTATFKMSEEVFRGARNATPGSAESFWSHTLYRGPAVDGMEPKVKVHYCKSKHTTERVIQQYFLDKKILGFDIEWKADTNRNQGAKKNVSLIQLACEDRIALFHIGLYPGEKVEDLVAPSLKKVMQDPTITKVGVAIKADCTRLRKYLDIHCKGIFELSHLYKLVKFSSSKDFKLINKRLVSLAVQVQEHLHLPLFKGEVRGSDWSLPLQMDQIIYAASDSYAGIHLYDALDIKRKALDPTPPRPYNAEEDKPIRLAEGLEIATDEELEPEELEPPPTTKKLYTQLSPSYLESAKESLELDPDFEVTPLSLPTTRSKLATAPKSPSTSKHPLIIAASAHADTYRSSHPGNRTTPSALRCYYIWYRNPELSLQDIAALLRETPLQTTTVVNYILEAIRLEKLPFKKEKLSGVLKVLPKEVIWGRYRTLARACGMLPERGAGI